MIPCARPLNGPLLADAKAREDRAEQVVGAERAGDLAERVVREPELLGQQLERADVVLAIFEANGDRDELEGLPSGAARVEVFNKSDLAPGFRAPAGAVAVSAKTGAGLERLRQAILEAAGWNSGGESVFLARERHLRALGLARAHLAAAARDTRHWEFFAEELRLAHAALGSIIGEFSADDLLGEIFARFCIGK